MTHLKSNNYVIKMLGVAGQKVFKSTRNSFILALMMICSFPSIALGATNSTKIGIGVNIKVIESCDFSYSLNSRIRNQHIYANCDVNLNSVDQFEEDVEKYASISTIENSEEKVLRVFKSVE